MLQHQKQQHYKAMHERLLLYPVKKSLTFWNIITVSSIPDLQRNSSTVVVVQSSSTGQIVIIFMLQFALDYISSVFHLALCSFRTITSISMLLYIILFHHIGVFLHLCLSFACMCASTIRHCLCIIAIRFSPTPTHSGCRSCTSIESVSIQAARPGKKAESSTEGSRCSSPSAPVQV